MKIYIDIGHGGTDPGAVSGQFREHEMAVDTAARLASGLVEAGFEAMLEDGDLTLADSAAAANRWGADALISVHYNAGGGDRGEAIYSIRDGSERLADAILAGLKAAGQTVVKKYTKLNGAGNADYFGILRGAKMPAAILEVCFIDNAKDVTLADTRQKRIQIGMAVAEAIAAEYKPPPRWSDDAVEWAKGNGLLKGDEKGDLRLDDTMTKEMMLVLLKRYHDMTS